MTNLKEQLEKAARKRILGRELVQESYRESEDLLKSLHAHNAEILSSTIPKLFKYEIVCNNGHLEEEIPVGETGVLLHLNGFLYGVQAAIPVEERFKIGICLEEVSIIESDVNYANVVYGYLKHALKKLGGDYLNKGEELTVGYNSPLAQETYKLTAGEQGYNIHDVLYDIRKIRERVYDLYNKECTLNTYIGSHSLQDSEFLEKHLFELVTAQADGLLCDWFELLEHNAFKKYYVLTLDWASENLHLFSERDLHVLMVSSYSEYNGPVSHPQLKNALKVEVGKRVELGLLSEKSARSLCSPIIPTF